MKVITLISIIGFLIVAQTPPPSQSDGKDIKYKRGFVHSGYLYLQGPYDPGRSGQVLRTNLDNPARVELLNFLVSESERVSSLMKISGADIYLSSIHDSGGGQISGGIEKFALNDLVATSTGFLVPSVAKLPSGAISPLKQVITTEPLNTSLVLSSKRAGRYMTPEQVSLRIQPKLRLWYDLVFGNDGFLYLYILEENKLTVW
jgi:hypothetical protein